MLAHLAVPLAAILVPYAASLRGGRLWAPAVAAALAGLAAASDPRAALLAAVWAAAGASLFAACRAFGASAHCAFAVVLFGLLAAFGSLFLLGPSVQAAVDRGVPFPRIQPAAQAILDAHPYPAVEMLLGRSALQNALYDDLGAYRLLPPDPLRGARLLAIVAAACALVAAPRLLRRGRAG
jgi:hypothetical protein